MSGASAAQRAIRARRARRARGDRRCRSCTRDRAAARRAHARDAGRARPREPRTLAPPERRLATVAANERGWAPTDLIAARDRDGPADPRPGQFYMLAAARALGRGSGRAALPAARVLVRARAAGRPAAAPARSSCSRTIGPGHRAAGASSSRARTLALRRPARDRLPPARAGTRPLLVGGGIGTAPLLCLHDELRRTPPVLLGFRSAAHAEAAALFRRRRGAGDRRRLGRARRAWSPSCSREAARRGPRGHRLRLRPAADARGRARALRRARRAGPARARVGHGLRLRRLLRLRGPDHATATCASAWTGRCSTPTALEPRP